MHYFRYLLMLLAALPWGVLPCAAGVAWAADQDDDIAPKESPLRKDVDQFTRIKFTRLAEEAFQAAVTPENPAWDEPTLLLHWVQAGKWEKVGGLLEQFEAEAVRRLHGKICSDLTYANPKSTILPQDVIALADASPVELDDKQISHLGGLVRLAMRDTESRTELVEILRKGTRRLGGPSERRRLMAARLLVNAQLLAEAKAFGIAEQDLQVEAALPEQAPATATRGWAELLAVLRKSLSNGGEVANDAARQAALDELHLLMLAGTPAEVDRQLRAIAADKAQPRVAGAVFAMIGEKTAASNREVDLTARALHIELQGRAMRQLAATTGFDAEPWQTLANLAANNWFNEAQFSYKLLPTWQKVTDPAARARYAHVSLEQLIEHAPSGAWLAAVEPQLASIMRITLARLILFSEDIDRVLPHVQALQQTDLVAAGSLANAYLENWARRHDPNLSAELLKQYKLDNQVVVLTRSQQAAALTQLAELLESLSPETRALLDEAQLVRAFDYCHSKAEIYTREHVVQVFGSLEKLPASLVLLISQRMRDKLAVQWREFTVQRDAATRRTAADIFTLVHDGYAEATGMAAAWLKSRPDSYRMNGAAGSLFSDWAEFSYFQGVAVEDGRDRFASYLEHSRQSLEHFRAGAKAYAAVVPSLTRAEYDLLPYKAWFHGLLGITHDAGINLRKGITAADLKELRQAMLDLPGGAGEVHLRLFSTMVAENIEAARIAPEMKYRYLSSAVQVTGSRATIYPAEEKIKYYDSLLQEIRLRTRLDGSDRIRAPGVFGVFVSLVHTADVARESGGFAKYLMNEVQRTVSGRTIVEKPLYRDRLEEALRVSLGNFFEIRAIVFADPAAGARGAETPPGAPQREWQETPLAYILLATKDPTVDRVPALEMELDFFDREGRVVIPVPSNPLQIELSAEAPPGRPAKNLAITQIVDSRELKDNLLKIDVAATADGLVPELDQVLDLKNYPHAIVEVADREGLQIERLHSGPEGIYPLSERSWTIHLDPAPLLRGAKDQVEFEFPAAMASDTEMVYRRYDDMDPVEAAARFTLVEGDEAARLSRIDYRVWGAGGIGLLAVAALAVLVARRGKDESLEAPPLFAVPGECTPFAVIALLQRIQTSPAVSLSEADRASLAADIHSLEQQTFARQAGSARTEDLQALARGWVSKALKSAKVVV